MEIRPHDIFSDTVKRLPVFCVHTEFNGESFIVGVYEKDPGFMGKTQHLAVLYEQEGIWHCEHEHELDDTDCYVTIEPNYEWVNDGQYIFLERSIQQVGTMFQGMGSVEFLLYEIATNTLNRIVYSGLYQVGGIQGRLQAGNFESKDKRFCENFLKEKFLESSNVYRTPKDFDLNDPKNYIKKWEIQNADFYNNEYGTVKFTFYDVPVLSNDSITTLEEAKASGNFTENDKFILFLCYQGTVVAYRKSDGKYFVVVVPQGWGGGGGWGMRSFIEPTFLADHVAYTRCSYEQYKINLDDGHYHRSDYSEK